MGPNHYLKSLIVVIIIGFIYISFKSQNACFLFVLLIGVASVIDAAKTMVIDFKIVNKFI